ncbi:Eukaryotic aspartyl protease family protein [Hibiscus syriacus]|uniref:Eukaryotic aspartyl protease family protein n=1 Tax=Hibiscus syriacus TaxID=106335 RepID=A0A6A2WWN2_HIBSY|nr:Eukaryotic aspartyl protease family protein [Hibiscus syriacus]
MWIDDDVGVERDDAVQTDDEEMARGNIQGDDSNIEPVLTPSSNYLELNNSWPQSYRESMDMFKGITPASISLNGTSPFSDYQSNDDETSLGKSLLSERTLNEQVPISILPDPLQRVSFHESIPSMKRLLVGFLYVGINVLSGIGLLMLLKEGGSWMSLTLLLIFGVVACYTGVLLKRCLESFPGLQTYPDIGQAAFGRSLYYRSACVENSHCSPTVWPRDLSLLSYLSVGGVGESILVVLCLLWVGTVNQTGFHRAGTALNLPNLPISVGIYSFCYAGHSVFPNIYSSMKEPSLFPLVLIISFIFCWFICTGAAISGFLIFGNSIESQFTLNMPIKFAASKVAVWTVVIITISKYALTLTPIASSLEELVPLTWSRSYGVSILIRTALVISTLVVAMAVPFFAFLTALAGSLLTMLIMGECIFIAIVGFLIACDGTYSALIRLAAGQR